MYSSKRFFLILLCAVIFFGRDVMACACDTADYTEQIKKTESVIVHEEILVESYGIFKGNLTKACALVRFKINDSGKAIEVEVVESSPTGVLDRVVLKTLNLYKFVPNIGNSDQNYYLVFKHSI